MSIQAYIREIGRGKASARSLSRDESCDLMGQILDNKVSDMQLGAFCLAMRVKGETAQEMAGFLDAIQSRLNYFKHPQTARPVIVIPSYNGARRLPVFTPLLAVLLAREGFAVLVHGSSTESTRVASQSVFAELGITQSQDTNALKPSEVVFAHTRFISPGIQRLLEVRASLGLRNSAHSLVKLLIPVQAEVQSLDGNRPLHVSQNHAFLISSYTHPEYAVSMQQTLALTRSSALLLRGCEGEPVADIRRAPSYAVLINGQLASSSKSATGTVKSVDLTQCEITPKGIAQFTQKILNNALPIPQPIKDQIELIKQFAAHNAV